MDKMVDMDESQLKNDEVLIVLDMNSVCRFCLETGGALTKIFEEDEKNNVLIDKLNDFVDIEITPNSTYPEKICHRCRYKIEICFSFKTLVLQSHSLLKKNLTVYDKNLSILQSNDYNMSDLIENCNDTQNDKIVKKSKRSDKNQNTQYPILDECADFTPNKAQCLLCFEVFANFTALHHHIDNHVQNTDLEPYYLLGERNIKCNKCDKRYDYRFSFLIHQREHLDLKPFECSFDSCQSKFHSKAALRQHSLVHSEERNFVCSICATRFKRKSDLKAHEIIHEDTTVKYECPVCGAKCKNRLTRLAHLRKHHKRPRFKCASCDKEYFSHSELERHKFIHLPEKGFRCNFCSYAYYSQSALVRHKKIHHKNKIDTNYIIKENDLNLFNDIT